MTELLIVKTGADYCRFTEDGFERCSMNKASVFPLEQLGEAKAWCAKLETVGVESVLMKLTISEEPFIEGERGK